MAPAGGNGKIFSATYSNVSFLICRLDDEHDVGWWMWVEVMLTSIQVPVYEYNVNGNHVMRRRSDDWINATHILKVADLDKPARTRVLEREVQKGVHEKVQGGYGKYQGPNSRSLRESSTLLMIREGTWVPLQDGRDLAQRNGVLEKLRPIFDYVPGNESPPQAPKHTTAASNKPKLPKAIAAPRRPPSMFGLTLTYRTILTDEQKQNQCRPRARSAKITTTTSAPNFMMMTVSAILQSLVRTRTI